MVRISAHAARSGNSSVRRVDLPVPALRSLEGCEVTGDYLRSVDAKVVVLHDDSPLRARIARVGDIRFWHVLTPQMEMHWPGADIGASRLLFLLSVSGRMSVTPVFPARRNPSRFVVVPGSAAASVVRFTAPRNEFLAMSIPDPGVVTIAGRANAPTIEPSILRPFVGFIDGITAVDDAEHLDASPLHSASKGVARSLVELAGGSLTDRRCLVTRATEIMLAEFEDPNLTTDALAARLRVSVRTLQTAFAKDGLTVRGMLRDVRARAARALRRDRPNASSRSVATASGFGSESAMFRALRDLGHDAQDPLEPRA